MPKFLIGYNFGYASTETRDVIEADTLEEAEEKAYRMALEWLDYYAEPYDPEKHDGTY